MIKKIKSSLARNLTNAKGWRTNRKIIVIESDDWGSIRMPNKHVYEKFSYKLDNDPYCRYDTLANSEDLNALFDVLRSYKNIKGYQPKFTFNTVMANPLFKRIKESNFTEYFYEPFPETLKRYYPNEDVLKLWKQGVNEKLIQPQFHGREHVNILTWLRKLKYGNKPLLEAFHLEFWGIPKSLYGNDKISIQAAFGFPGEQQLDFYKKNITEGLDLFEKIFRFRSKTFIANNYTYPEDLNTVLLDAGVIGVQSMRKHKKPNINSSISSRTVFTGKESKFPQKYTVRNCIFEPSQMPKYFDNIGSCLNQISNSFFWKKPAIITSHRLNYIGSIKKENRNHNLGILKVLLDKVIKKWPDVEFLSSDELIEYINRPNSKNNS